MLKSEQRLVASIVLALCAFVDLVFLLISYDWIFAFTGLLLAMACVKNLHGFFVHRKYERTAKPNREISYNDPG